jgi:hypothetical protein
MIFLEQSSAVNLLLNSAVKSLNYIQDKETKTKLIESLKPFCSAIAPTTIDVYEIKSLAKELKIEMSNTEALEVLTDLCVSFDLNCVNNYIRFYFDEVISCQMQVSNK